MIHTVRVRTTQGPDSKGASVLADLRHRLPRLSVEDVQTAKVYRVEGITKSEAKNLAEKLFAEKINQQYTINTPILTGAHHTIEIAYKPGVMNPEVASVIKAAHDMNIYPTAADSSYEYGFFGKLTKQQAEEGIFMLNLLNKTVEYIISQEPKTLLIKGSVGPTTIIPIRSISDDALMELSKDKLFLNLEEMKTIQAYFQKIKRDPTDCELETLAQTWSEHSGHKTFKATLVVDGKKKIPLITRIKKEALKHKKNIVSAFVDNSGVMDFYDGMAICGKVETHNSPSAIEPYGGAMTGSGGVFRDILGTGKGAKAVVSTDMFCFAPWDMDLKKLPPGSLPPQYLLQRVITGVKDYGNRMGIPTNNGSIHFHEDFRAKPTVIVGAYGIIPKKQAIIGKPKKGDLIICVGGKTGRDGIHGATFSSGEMTDRTINVNSSAVQIGNAIEEKRMFDALLEARDAKTIRAMQDVGGGGFSSAIGELGKDVGVTVNLEKAPLKYQGLSPWEIWISESQERMIVAVEKKQKNKFLSICKKYNVDVTILGIFDGSKTLRVTYGKKIVCNMSMSFLHDGLPRRNMVAKYPEKKENSVTKPITPKTEKEWVDVLRKILAHGDICSKEPIVRLYDHTVQGTNSLQPFSGEKLDGPNDASVIRPLLKKPYGMIVAHGMNPILNRIDPYWGSIWAATEAIANYVAVGGNYKDASLINNYIWPFPDTESLWSLDKSVDAVVDFMKLLKIPVISGKDSLSSTYRGKDGTVIKIPPVLCMSVFGKTPDVAKTVSSDFKKDSSIICLVGKPHMALGGSTYYTTQGITGADVPKVDVKTLPKVLQAIHTGIQKKQILSSHDISEGGLFTTLFEMCLGGNMGASLDIPNGKTEADAFLFNETAGCFLIEVANKETAKKLFDNVPYKVIGKTKKEFSITAIQNKQTLFTANVQVLKNTWQKPMKELFS